MVARSAITQDEVYRALASKEVEAVLRSDQFRFHFEGYYHVWSFNKNIIGERYQIGAYDRLRDANVLDTGLPFFDIRYHYPDRISIRLKEGVLDIVAELTSGYILGSDFWNPDRTPWGTKSIKFYVEADEDNECTRRAINELLSFSFFRRKKNPNSNDVELVIFPKIEKYISECRGAEANEPFKVPEIFIYELLEKNGFSYSATKKALRYLSDRNLLKTDGGYIRLVESDQSNK